jgi:plastocyanin
MMKRIGLGFLSLLILSMNLGICADMSQPGASTVDIKGFSFQPDSITVQVGTAVTWVNHDSVDHTITSDGVKFDSGNIMSGGQFRFVFSQPGTYSYHCAIHPSMTGVVTVISDQKDNGQSAAKNSTVSQKTAPNATGTSPPASAPAAKQPGFEVIFAVTSILAAGYLLSATKQ